ncbi:MAG: YraN family protein [Micrococcales bacterium]|nr:YraN family protein [Micrococcales bacterium]
MYNCSTAGGVDLSRQALGRFGEARAARYLESIGYQVVERNWRSRAGEVDLVALDADCLVFVEVKTRSSLNFGSPAAAISPAKLARLRRLAGAYLAERRPGVDKVRIDVVAVLTGGGPNRLQHFKAVQS